MLRQLRLSKFSTHHLKVTSLILILFSACSPQDTLSPEERVQAQAAFESCLICHSAQEMQRGPIVDGLPAWYAKHQLEKFQSGIRGQVPENRSEHLMGSARDRFVDPETINLLSRYIESLPPKNHRKVVRGDSEKGKLAYVSCITCHGTNGEGNTLLKSPPLNIQEDWYLLDQLRKFAKGARGYHSDDFTGQQMAAALNGLDDQTLKDLIAHIQTFQR
ncbi:MAG: c-type cytochrome [Opitutales bacterium]|nr:c-type cytochrome [Opitutales bacterium]